FHASSTTARHTLSLHDALPIYFEYDPAQCIVCSRCVRACEEVQGTFALTIEGRGFESRMVASMHEDFIASECVSCGACVQACPRSEEHTSELQSRENLVCRLLL